MRVPDDCLYTILDFCPVRSIGSLMCSSAMLPSICTKEAGLRTVAELDDEVALFFPGRTISVVDRAWVAEHPPRLHYASRRRWRRLANSPAREPAAASQARLAALATRTHRLSQAIARGDLPLLKNLFALGLDLTAQLRGYGFTTEGETALHAACKAKQPALVAWMLQRGADPTARDGNECSAADVVADLATCGKSSAVQVLLKSHTSYTSGVDNNQLFINPLDWKRVQPYKPSAVARAVSKALTLTKPKRKRVTDVTVAAAPRSTPEDLRSCESNPRPSRFRGALPVNRFDVARGERRALVGREHGNEAAQRTKRHALQEHFARETFLAPFGR